MSGPWFRARWLMIYPITMWGWLAYATFFAAGVVSIWAEETFDSATHWAPTVALSAAFIAMLALGLTLILKTEKR